ncbi:MAG TPA: HAD family acid phosphatase, partial [Jatrophihabitantaceae bacterium]|nr:HAD family acid phosphatase [Jatrophihabitantaceae bacterium]
MRRDSIEHDTDPSGPRRRRSRHSIAGAAIAAAGLLVSGVAASSPTPKHGDDIPNVTQVENQIKAYYGDTVVGTDHFPSPTGNYAQEVEGIETHAQQYLAHHSTHDQGAPAVVFDVDDTTLNTYNYEIFSGFAFNPTTNADFVNTERFPAVFGMPDLVNW